MMNKENGSKRVSAKEVAQADDFCEEYKDFLNKAKTEREAVAYAIQIAKEMALLNILLAQSIRLAIRFMSIIEIRQLCLQLLAKTVLRTVFILV